MEVDFEILANCEDKPTADDEKRNSKWLPLLHLSGLFLLIVPPILVWIWKRDDVRDIRKHAVDVINFQLSMFLYILPFVFAPPILIALLVFSQIVIMINTIKVTSDKVYKYPLSIRFLKQESPV